MKNSAIEIIPELGFPNPLLTLLSLMALLIFLLLTFNLTVQNCGAINKFYQTRGESYQIGDSGYTNYEIEDMLWESGQVKSTTSRKKNLNRKDIPAVAFVEKHISKWIETSINRICSSMLRHINAVTTDASIIKLILFVLAFQFVKTIL